MTSAERATDQQAFADVAERYRRQLHLHCYRMLGSFDDAEDLVQETLVRAWRSRNAFEGRSSLETWLYRIATNACLNALRRSPKARILPADVVQPVTITTDASEARHEPPYHPELPWLQPYPDDLLDHDPESKTIQRETIELAYLVALQHLPPRQRAILILRDVLGWSANETADILEITPQAANSALQRARATLRAELSDSRDAWSAQTDRTQTEDEVLQAFMHAWDRADTAAITAMLKEDARWSMPPAALWFLGRASIERLFQLFPLEQSGEFRTIAVRANRQPAAAGYLRRPGEAEFRLNAVSVLTIAPDNTISAITQFGAELCRGFRLPTTLPAEHR